MTIQIVNAREMGISPRHLVLGKGKRPSQRGKLSPGKQFPRVLTALQITLSPLMGQCWAEPHLDLLCLDLHILGPLFKLNLSLEAQSQTLGVSCSQCVHNGRIFPFSAFCFNFDLLIDLLKTASQT